MDTLPWIIVIIVAFIVFWLIATYNGLIRLKNRTEEAWSDIDVQLKRRYDLIPNLVETVKGYAKHERELFEKVTQARTRAMEAKNPKEQGEAENMLTGTLKTLFAVAENYPDLKANQNFLALGEELTSTENKIAFSRQNYNDQVLFFNNKIQMFPSNIIAGMFSFKAEDFFEIENKAEKEVPKVQF